MRVLPVLLAGVLTLLVGAVPAAALPPLPAFPAPPAVPAPPAFPAQPPDNAEDAAAQLEVVQREAEALTELWHAARDELSARQEELDTFRAAIGPAIAAADAARAAEEEFRVQADALITSTFESGNLDQLNALLASGSPQDFLDQMSALELLASDQREALDRLAAVVEQTSATRAEADAAIARAQAAADAAVAAEQDLDARRREADARVEEAEELLDRLTPQQRSARIGVSVGAPSGPITGSGVGVDALRAAATELGEPYEWGAEGPDSYDCSGLTSWAFSEAGITLPRSSSQQARVGSEVSFGDLRPGDLVFFYEPISHVGIYAGDGRMINAPQTGDVVKYSTVNRDNFTTARRL